MLAPLNSYMQKGCCGPGEEIVDSSAIQHEGENGGLVSMLLFQKFHGLNTCGSLLHRRLYVILDKSFQLLEFVGASVSTGITMKMFADGHAALAGGHVGDGARFLAFSDFKRGFRPSANF